MTAPVSSAYFDVIAQRESGGVTPAFGLTSEARYEIVNTLDYLGKYQMGNAALVEAGFYTGSVSGDGVQVWVNEINEAGGIHGRKLRLVVYDDGGSPQEALAAVRRLVDQDKVFMLMAGSTSGATLPVIPPFGSGRTSIHVVPGCSTMSSPDLVTR